MNTASASNVTIGPEATEDYKVIASIQVPAGARKISALISGGWLNSKRGQLLIKLRTAGSLTIEGDSFVGGFETFGATSWNEIAPAGGPSLDGTELQPGTKGDDSDETISGFISGAFTALTAGPLELVAAAPSPMEEATTSDVATIRCASLIVI